MSTISQQGRAVVTFYPPVAYTINTLTYPPIHTAFIPVPDPQAPTLITLPSETPLTTFLFLYLKQSTRTHLTYDANSHTITPSEFTNIVPSALGTPGVALVNNSHWQNLCSHISECTLGAAGVTPGVAADTVSFPPIPKLHENRSGNELTFFYHNRTTYLAELIRTRYSGDDIRLLGELQLAFLSFCILSVAEGLDVWTRLVGEICRSDDIDRVYEGFSDRFSHVLGGEISFLCQSTHDSGDVVGVVIEELSADLTRFLDNHHSCGKLRALLTTAGWEAVEEEGPTVV